MALGGNDMRWFDGGIISSERSDEYECGGPRLPRAVDPFRVRPPCFASLRIEDTPLLLNV